MNTKVHIMASKIKFLLRDNQSNFTQSKQIPTQIFLLMSYGYHTIVDGKKNYVRLKYYTDYKVHPAIFKDNRIKDLTALQSTSALYESQDHYDKINKKLDDLEKIVSDLLLDHKHEPPNKLRELIDLKLNPLPEEAVMTLQLFMKTYIEELESINKKALKPGTIRALKSSVKIFNEFCDHKKKDYDFNDIDLAFHEDFVYYLYTERSYSDNAVGNQIKNLKAIMKKAKDQELHSNLAYTYKDFEKPSSDSHSIALTQKEVNALANLNLSDNPEYDLIRDIFLCGCYTAQRISDYSRLNKSMIKGKILEFKQIKTRTKVKIPINTPLRKILAKYDYNLPKVSDQDLNFHIKLIARMAKITDIETWEVECRKNVTTETAERCTLISSHTARRTGATLMYKKKLSIAALQKITGHKSEKQLSIYLKIDPEELLEEAMDNKFFK